MTHLFTIGYEGATPEAFDATLQSSGVERLVDLRAVAVSRRKGFSKTGLAARIEGHGIDYTHLRALGDPKPGRDAARAGQFSLFRTIYAQHLQSAEAQAALEELQSLAERQRLALLCFEADAAHCHRTMVALSVAKASELAIVHLKVELEPKSNGAAARTYDHPYQGLAAA
ncbi:DUF488 domain-containing protein [Caulobacter segnis]|uniref:DUF488 domain-containing protein n=1 Tax=Caulobacter segnis TaxID=88688 RepID=UPI0024101D4A|nr:DUF488 domain-containing protein [Caulobacter segnis]MDG2522161.1 DUF488 domain-containing protein [Caulobacter segnis]